jgi:hypothetical protein
VQGTRRSENKGKRNVVVVVVVVIVVPDGDDSDNVRKICPDKWDVICTGNFIDTVRMCKLYVQECFTSGVLGRAGGFIAVGAAP